jgi:phage terminase large subunit GpA-like protein
MLLMTFVTAWLAEPWEVHVNELKDFEVRARCTDYFVGQIPEGARAVTFGVDVQARGEQTYQYYVVRAWGADGQSWLVRYGVAQSWSVLNAVIFDADYGSVTKIRPLVDSGFRTGEVYEWCSAVGGIASKGDARNRQHVSHTTIAKGPDTPDVVEFVSFNPDYYKTWLHRLMRQPDRWHLPREVDDEYVEHMVAEQQQFVPDKRTGRQRVEWKLRSEGRANHYFDCEVLALVIADLSQIAHPAVVPAETPKAVSKPEEENRPSAMKPVAYWREKKKPAAGVVRMFS